MVKEEQYENKKRIYEIPEDGVLKTKFSFNKGLISLKDIRFFYQNSKTKERRELVYNANIPYRKDESLSDKDVIVFSKRYGTGFTNGDNQNTTFTSLLVGRVIDADSLFDERENTHTPDKIKN